MYVFQRKDQFFFNYVYHLYMYIFKLDFLKLLGLESRIIETAFQFAFTIIMLLFTARITNVLQQQENAGGVSSVDDVRGFRIASGLNFKDYVESIGARFVSLPIFTYSYIDSYNAVLALGCNYGMTDTFILETLSEYQCDFKLPLKDVYKIDYSIVWGSNAPRELIEKIDFGIMLALDAKNQSVRQEPIIAQFGPTYGLTRCRDTFSTGVTANGSIYYGDISSLWVIWLIGLIIAGLGFGLSRLMKHRFKMSRTPFDQEIRGKRENSIKNSLFADLSGKILISLEFLRKEKCFIIESSRYCYEKMPIKPEIRHEIRSLINNDEDIKSLFLCNPIDSLFKKNSTISLAMNGLKKSWLSKPNRSRIKSRMSPPSLSPTSKITEGFSDKFLNFSSEDIVLSPTRVKELKNFNRLFTKDLEDRIRELNIDSPFKFPKSELKKHSIHLANRNVMLNHHRKEAIKDLSSNFELELEPMQQRFSQAAVADASNKFLIASLSPPKKRKSLKNGTLKNFFSLNNAISSLFRQEHQQANLIDIENTTTFQRINSNIETQVKAEIKQENLNSDGPLRTRIFKKISKMEEPNDGKKNNKKNMQNSPKPIQPMNLKKIDRK